MTEAETLALIASAVQVERKCESCDSHGYEHGHRCPACDGTGRELTPFGRSVVEMMERRKG